MRLFAIAALLSLPMFAGELKIDHITVAGQNLDAMRQAFTAATGLPTQYGGRHANHATEMATVSFPDGSYLELIAIQKNADPAAVAAHSWSAFMKSNAGPCAFAIRAPDMSALTHRLRSAGVKVGVPQSSGRTRPDGTRLDWETTDVGPGPHGSFFPFLIRDVTPRENRAYPSGKPTTDQLTGVDLVVIGVSHLKDAVAKYWSAFRLAEPKVQTYERLGAKLAWFEGTPVVLAEATSEESWLTQRIRQFGEAPCAFVFKQSRGVLAVDGVLPQRLFGRLITWQNEQTLGWRLGMEF